MSDVRVIVDARSSFKGCIGTIVQRAKGRKLLRVPFNGHEYEMWFQDGELALDEEDRQ